MGKENTFIREKERGRIKFFEESFLVITSFSSTNHVSPANNTDFVDQTSFIYFCGLVFLRVAFLHWLGSEKQILALKAKRNHYITIRYFPLLRCTSKLCFSSTREACLQIHRKIGLLPSESMHYASDSLDPCFSMCDSVIP